MERDFDKIRYWIQHYGQGDVEDKRGVENVVICEGDEFLRPFQTQLYAVSRGDFSEEGMDKLVGPKRKIKYTSYENWAKLMLLWLQESRKK